MDFTPLGERAAHSSLTGNVETRCELAYIVKDEQTARRERRIPKIKFGEHRLVLVRTVENDQLGGAVEIFPRGRNRSIIQRSAFGDFDKILQARANDPAAGQLAHRRI